MRALDQLEARARDLRELYERLGRIEERYRAATETARRALTGYMETRTAILEFFELHSIEPDEIPELPVPLENAESVSTGAEAEGTQPPAVPPEVAEALNEAADIRREREAAYRVADLALQSAKRTFAAEVSRAEKIEDAAHAEAVIADATVNRDLAVNDYVAAWQDLQEFYRESGTEREEPIPPLHVALTEAPEAAESPPTPSEGEGTQEDGESAGAPEERQRDVIPAYYVRVAGWAPPKGKTRAAIAGDWPQWADSVLLVERRGGGVLRLIANGHIGELPPFGIEVAPFSEPVTMTFRMLLRGPCYEAQLSESQVAVLLGE